MKKMVILIYERLLFLHPFKSDYRAYVYFAEPHDRDWLRQSFKAADPQLSDLKSRHQCTFRIDPSVLPADRFDTKIIRVRLALVGASHPAGEVSCEVVAYSQ